MVDNPVQHQSRPKGWASTKQYKFHINITHNAEHSKPRTPRQAKDITSARSHFYSIYKPSQQDEREAGQFHLAPIKLRGSVVSHAR